MGSRKKKLKKGFARKLLAAILVLVVALAGYSAWRFYHLIYSPNTQLSEPERYFYIATGSDFKMVSNSLVEQGIIWKQSSFEWLAEQKHYDHNVKPGRYLIRPGMSNNDLVNLLRSGKQEPVKVILNNLRFKEELAGMAATEIEADSTDIIHLLNDQGRAEDFGFNTSTILTLFIPNTYQFMWNTSAEQFLDRMAKEYRKFWTAKRKKQANNLGLSQSEVSILASIVQKETNKDDEKPMIAGVYLNRLRRGMLLQADPTVVYATRDFTARRVLKKHTKVDSPYNTYQHKGLPPGPICLPSISSLDAVLNAKKHDYLFFCAKADRSGYHAFASTYRQHKQNARAFQRELDRNKIYR